MTRKARQPWYPSLVPAEAIKTLKTVRRLTPHLRDEDREEPIQLEQVIADLHWIGIDGPMLYRDVDGFARWATGDKRRLIINAHLTKQYLQGGVRELGEISLSDLAVLYERTLAGQITDRARLRRAVEEHDFDALPDQVAALLRFQLRHPTSAAEPPDPQGPIPPLADEPRAPSPEKVRAKRGSRP
jgi:hypothetical protein